MPSWLGPPLLSAKGRRVPFKTPPTPGHQPFQNASTGARAMHLLTQRHLRLFSQVERSLKSLFNLIATPILPLTVWSYRVFPLKLDLKPVLIVADLDFSPLKKEPGCLLASSVGLLSPFEWQLSDKRAFYVDLSSLCGRQHTRQMKNKKTWRKKRQTRRIEYGEYLISTQNGICSWLLTIIMHIDYVLEIKWIENLKNWLTLQHFLPNIGWQCADNWIPLTIAVSL